MNTIEYDFFFDNKYAFYKIVYYSAARHNFL